jgi:hypothetical protein
VTDDGRILFGAYLGHTGRIDWSRTRRGRAWRFLRSKRWQYASIIGADCVAAVVVADIGWATTAFAYLFDRRSRQVLADVSLVGLPRTSGRVADHVGVGALSTFRRGGTRLSIEHAPDGWRISVRSPTLTLDATLDEGPTAATVCAIARVPGGVANCTHKTHGLRARGEARAGGQEFRLDDAMGALDHTSGLLAYQTAWRWASGASLGMAINLVQGFHDPLENALWRDGGISPLEPVAFSRASEDPMATWRIVSADGSVELVFTPEGVRSQDKDLGFAVSRWIQPMSASYPGSSRITSPAGSPVR